MDEWREVSLGEVLTLQRGFDITKKEQRRGSVPVVSSSGIGSFHDEAKVSGPGVVIGRKGSLGTAFFLDRPFWPHDTTLWVKDFKGNVPYFCFLLLKTLSLRELDVGSSNPTLNRNHVHQLNVRRPCLKTQKRIAAIGQAFDELIEINERRIELLEDLARSLYREWFVRLHFPGYDDVDLVESDVGLIPDGWEVRSVGEVLEVIGGGTPSKGHDEYWDGGMIPWFTPSDLTRSGQRFVEMSSNAISDLGLARSSAQLFPPGSVLMTSRATLGVLAISIVEASCNQGFIVIPPTTGMPAEFIFEWLQAKALELEQISTGATFKEITKGAFKRFALLVPHSAVLGAFVEIARPINQMIACLEQSNRHHAATRDLLLPRLVSGNLDVSDVDLDILTPADEE